MSSHFLSHVLFGVSTLLALIAAVSAAGDLLGWWQSLLTTSMLVSTVVAPLLLTLWAGRIRGDRRGAAT